ncbi:MAG: histidinol-phosphate transaminase [Verrucomicrobia bacterium]|nr:MAG: histidinol-phosphate transaminase [Verrucomicrobiota bacterium]
MSHFIRQAVEKMSGYTPGEQPQVPGLIKLNTNENPYPPSPRVAGVLKNFTAESLRLYPDPLAVKLREAMARKHGCKLENVFAGNGSDEVLALCTRALVEPGGSIGFFEPSYSLYSVLAEIQDVMQKPVRLNADFSWRMDAGYSASLFFLANPNAPTGIQYPRETIRTFCQKFTGVVLLDEAYVDFADYDGTDLALELPNVLVARTLSKSSSLAGLRLGYALGPEPLIAALYKIKDSYNLDRLTQELGCAAIEDGDHLRRNADKIKVTRAYVAAALTQIGCKVFPSATNFLWVEPARRSAADVFSELRQRKILVRYFPGPLTGHCLRITIGTDAEMEKLLVAMRKILAGT